MTVAFTAEHHIDAETLREVLHRPAELAAWLDRALAAGSTDHTAQLDPAVDELVAAGWLERSDGAVRASGPCAALLADLRSTMDDAAEVVWGGVSAVPALAGTLSAMARAAVGASPGPTFDALVGTAGDGTPAAVLLDRISALRHHRADCSAAAGGAAAADRMAARPYRPLQPSARQSLLDALRALPS